MSLMAPDWTLDAEPGTPKWWLRRLENERTNRLPDMQRFRDLVDGEHPAIQSSETAQKFVRMAGLATTNLTGLAVEATAERMVVEGVRIGDDPDSDRDVWDIWQRSDFDAGSQEAIDAALVYSRSYISVEPPNGSRPWPHLHYEDPRQVVVSTTPEGERAAALKVFTDEWTGDTFGTLYLPNVVIKMRKRGTPGLADERWLARETRDQPAVVRNPLGEVPFFELRNRILGRTVSEVAMLEIPQAKLNQSVFNVLALDDYGAFRQKWAAGIEVPRDPTTNKPMAPYEAHVSKLWVAEQADARFGDFNATDLRPSIEWIREQVALFAAVSRVPVTYFLANVANLSADALALVISGLVHKCGRRVLGYKPGIEGAIRCMLRALSDPRANVANIESKWAEMETYSMAQSADAAVKLTQGENPVLTPQTAQERYLGMSQTERDRDDAWRREGRAASSLDAVLAAAQTAALP